ncbi:MAG TPA: VWA domain-containing protein [Candidatus Eisenbacteria bacterium]|nr:VWA domain-containing protein [Candidatus Eisenbacteria bacterium]
MRKQVPASSLLTVSLVVAFAAVGIPVPASAASPSTGNDVSETVELAAAEFLPATSPGAAGPQSWSIAAAVLPGYTIRRTVPEVRLQFSVADQRGRLVTDLSASDIRILDDHNAVPQIRQFSRVDDLPLQVGLLVDVSDSVQKSISREKLATEFFVGQVFRPQTDRAFLMAFSREVKLWQTSTGDRDALRQALDRVRQAGYVTNLYDSVYDACLHQFPQFGDKELVQRVIVLFSDGEDTGSLHGLSDAIAQAQRHEIQIYVLSVHPRQKYSPGDAILLRMAEETGGQLYVAASEKDFASIFAAMERQMRTQYSVSFPPERTTPGFHELRVETTANPNLHVHSRQGYYFDAL